MNKPLLKKAGVVIDKLVVITNKGFLDPEGSLPLGYIVDELVYLSRGYSEKERADLQNIGLTAVKSRVKRTKATLGFNTRPHAVSIGIQSGYIPINVQEHPDFESLSWMQHQVLSFSAAGWNTTEISKLYDISPNTVDRYYEEIRTKLQAHNMPHAVRRAFELGIFNLGEPLEEVHGHKLEASITPAVKKGAKPLKITDHRQIELLKILADQKEGWISSEEAMAAGFYEGVASKGRQFQFGRMMTILSKNLEAAAGRPLIGRAKIRINGIRTNIYMALDGLVVEIGEAKHIIPPYIFPSSPNQKSEVGPRKQKPHRRKKRPAPKKPKPIVAKEPLTPPAKKESAEDNEPAVEPVAKIELPLPPVLLNEDKLLPLEKALAGLKRRKKTELEVASRQAMYQISRSGFISYKEKAVMALRYGVRFEALNLTALKRGAGPMVPIEDLNVHFPVDHIGLRLESASQISGLSPYGVLDVEEKLLSKHIDKFPQLAGRLAHIKAKKQAWVEAYQEKMGSPETA